VTIRNIYFDKFLLPNRCQKIIYVFIFCDDNILNRTEQFSHQIASQIYLLLFTISIPSSSLSSKNNNIYYLRILIKKSEGFWKMDIFKMSKIENLKYFLKKTLKIHFITIML